MSVCPGRHADLLHLGLVSSNGVAWNASRDCPLSEHSIPPGTLRGQWPPLQEHSNKTVALNMPFCSLLSSSYIEWKQLGQFHQISDTLLISRTIYLPIIDILSFTIYTAKQHTPSSEFLWLFMSPAWKVRRGHLVFGSSVRPSVCPSVRLFVRPSVCPSVIPSRLHSKCNI